MNNQSKKHWTEIEDAILRRHYRTSNLTGMVKRLPNRSEDAIKLRASNLKLSSKSTWSSTDIELLTTNYKDMTYSELAKLLQRSHVAIIKKSRKLGLKSKAIDNSWTTKEDEIIVLNYGHYSYKEIAKLIKTRTATAIKVRAKVLGITHPKKLWTKEETDILINEYSSNPSITDKLPRWDWESIKSKAQLYNLRVRYGTYKFNHNIFEQLDNSSAYVVGFIAADGYLNIKANRIEICINKKDRKLLNSIRDVLGYKGPIYEKSKVNAVRLQIASTKLLTDLMNILGVSNNKTFGLKEVKISDKFLPHFFRGYFDGDGSINKKGTSLITLGTEMFLNHLFNRISSILNIRYKPAKRKGHENVFITSYFGKELRKICNWMYSDANIFLKRKYDRYITV